MRTHNLFISHSWDYSNYYQNLVALLDGRESFDYRNYSVSRDDPIHNARNDAQLSLAIQNRMRSCGVVLVLAGVYATYSKWIGIELAIAKSAFQRPKPIIAVKPRDNTRISAIVREEASEIVNWNTDSIVAAIRRWS